MIKVEKLNKYFNKGKQNSIHVINNTSLKFPNKGLVTLLGESGSGKTTLLNVISGLDKAEGKIQFKDIKMTKYKSSTWDKIRAHDIGFIFQNYYLLEEKTVYDNIKIVLNMIGIIDKKEVDYRIEYVLNSVNMYRFRNKKASDLSGGQKQRVAIARALAKNPDVIIADEPTGNLDSKNSLEVMKIIKKISEEKLVVLVTHNKNLANLYSDRIINIKDGKVISDNINEANNIDFDYVDDNIYLKDLNNYSNNEFVKIYSNNEIEKMDLTIVKINNNYYIQTKNNENINIITEKSNTKFLDISKKDIENDHFETEFSLDELEKHNTKRVKKRTLSLKEAFVESLRKITNLGKKSKVQIFALILLGIMFSSAIHSLFSNLVLDQNKIYEDKNVYIANDYNIDLDDNFIIRYKDSNINNNILIELNDRIGSISTKLNLLPIEAIKEKDLTNGILPKNNNEVVIDETILDNQYDKSYLFYQYGILKPKDLLNQKLIIQNKEIKVVGTVKTNTKSLYGFEELYLNLININTQINYETISFKNNLNKLVEGRFPNKNDDILEVVVSNRYYELNEKIVLSEFPMRVIAEVVGLVDEDSDIVYINKEVYENELEKLLNDKILKDRFTIEVYALNNKKPVNDELYNLRENIINNLKKTQKQTVAASTIQITITIIISGVIFYFLVRSSLTSRVREISILRSLGVNKKEVITLYGLEYLIMTTVTSMIGVVLGTLLTRSISRSFLSEVIQIRVTPISIIISIVLIYVTNIIIALIPVFNLLRKTPAEMLTTYDI